MIYVDVTNTVVNKGKTGIQRVVRELSLRMCKQRADLTLIHFDRSAGSYAALKTGISLGDDIVTEFVDSPENGRSWPEFRCGDIFVELDAAWGDPLDRFSLLMHLKKKGVIVVCVHYDAVPVLFPDFSHPNTVYRYGCYLAAHLDCADYFFCISDTVRNDLQNVSLKLTGRAVSAFTFPLGADFVWSENTGEGIPGNEVVDRLLTEKYILVVGTIEPRKNHRMLLAGYDLITEQSRPKLVLVGKQGWNVEELTAMIKARVDFGNQVYWLDNLDDNQLRRLYEKAFVCVTTSHYEGFGLPVIESLSHNSVTVCTRGGALEEAANGAGCILEENTAQCLAETMVELTDNQALYDRYHECAKKYQPPAWKDSCHRFLEILNTVEKGDEFNFGFIPRQAVYISIDVEQIGYSIQSILRNMTFIEDFVILTADRFRDKMIKVLEATSKEFTVITDEELFDNFHVKSSDFTDHQQRNTFLRKVLYQEEVIDANFIAFDDDYLVQRDVGVDFYLKDECHYGYSFYADTTQWLGTPQGATSYDEGLWRTGNLLASCGYKSRCFSSHMPQIINKKMARLVFGRMINSQAEGMDEWSLYFNIFSHLYPDHCQTKGYAAICWPGNPTDWIPTELPADCYFENYYKCNYESGGRFEGLEIIGDFVKKVSIWKKAFAHQYYQRGLCRQQLGMDDPEVVISKSSLKAAFTSLRVIAYELLRIKLIVKTELEEEAQLKGRLFYKGRLLAETSVDISAARWLPINIRTYYSSTVLELIYYLPSSKRTIDRFQIEIILADISA